MYTDHYTLNTCLVLPQTWVTGKWMHCLFRYTLEQKVKVILYLIQVEQSTLILVDARELRLWTHSGKARGQECKLHKERCSPWTSRSSNETVQAISVPVAKHYTSVTRSSFPNIWCVHSIIIQPPNIQSSCLSSKTSTTKYNTQSGVTYWYAFTTGTQTGQTRREQHMWKLWPLASSYK